MDIEGVRNQDGYVPVYLVDGDDLRTPRTGVAVGDITVKFWKVGATSQTAYSPTAEDWKEAGNGNYSLNIGASEWTSEGLWLYEVAGTGLKTYTGLVQVRDMTIASLMDGVVVDSLSTNGVAAIAQAVWNAAYTTYKSAGTMGRLLLWAFLRMCGKRTITRTSTPTETVFDTDDTEAFHVDTSRTESAWTFTPSDQTP